MVHSFNLIFTSCFSVRPSSPFSTTARCPSRSRPIDDSSSDDRTKGPRTYSRQNASNCRLIRDVSALSPYPYNVFDFSTEMASSSSAVSRCPSLDVLSSTPFRLRSDRRTSRSVPRDGRSSFFKHVQRRERNCML